MVAVCIASSRVGTRIIASGWARWRVTFFAFFSRLRLPPPKGSIQSSSSSSRAFWLRRPRRLLDQNDCCGGAISASFCSIGNKNKSVLPEPVCAHTIKSSPLSAGGSASDWMAFGDVISSRLRPRMSSGRNKSRNRILAGVDVEQARNSWRWWRSSGAASERVADRMASRGHRRASFWALVVDSLIRRSKRRVPLVLRQPQQRELGLWHAVGRQEGCMHAPRVRLGLLARL